jgi:hypothetical protein
MREKILSSLFVIFWISVEAPCAVPHIAASLNRKMVRQWTNATSSRPSHARIAAHWSTLHVQSLWWSSL